MMNSANQLDLDATLATIDKLPSILTQHPIWFDAVITCLATAVIVVVLLIAARRLAKFF